MKIDKINTLPNICKEKEATKQGAQRRSNEDIDELLEEIHRKDELDTKFNIEYDG